jgi:hypothetical protein
MRESINAFKIFVGGTEWKGGLVVGGRANMIFDFKERGCECVDWVQLAEHMIQWWAAVKTVINLRVS